MNARMKSPAVVVPGAMEAIQLLNAAIDKGDVPAKTLGLVHLRASQINGCSVCVDMHPRHMKQTGETSERILAVAAWRHTPYFTDAERAALALTEAVTRLADREDAVPDAVWKEATKHFDEKALGTLLLSIGLVNLFNRLNVATALVAGTQRW